MHVGHAAINAPPLKKNSRNKNVFKFIVDPFCGHFSSLLIRYVFLEYNILFSVCNNYKNKNFLRVLVRWTQILQGV